MIRTQKLHAYAEALLRFTSEAPVDVDWNEQAWKICLILDSNQRFVQIIADKQFDLVERQALIDEIFAKSGEFDPRFIYFLKVLADNNAFLSARAILHAFIKLVDEKNHVRYITIYSYFPLSAEEISRFERALCKKLNVQKVLINNVVDKSLICGARVVAESHTIDNSIRGKMDIMLKEVLSHKLNLIKLDSEEK